jgi:hypothetical protein
MFGEWTGGCQYSKKVSERLRLRLRGIVFTANTHAS